MKKIILMSAFLMGFSILQTKAQVHVNVNLGAPVEKAPFYNDQDDYYYMPDYGVYYNVRRRVYVYQDDGHWLYNQNLPDRYQQADYRHAHYIRVHDRQPYMREGDYHTRYYHQEERHGMDDHRNYHGDYRHDDHRDGDRH